MREMSQDDHGGMSGRLGKDIRRPEEDHGETRGRSGEDHHVVANLLVSN